LNWTETRTQLYTSNGTVDAFIQSEDNENVYVFTRSFTDRDDDGVEVTYHDSATDTFTLDIANSSLSRDESYSQGDTVEAAGAIEEDERELEQVTTYPTGETWRRGKTMTFSGVETTDRTRSRNTADDNWSAWSDNGLDFQRYTFVNYGSFMTWLPYSASQSLGSGAAVQ
jgi:hypothetical protein